MKRIIGVRLSKLSKLYYFEILDQEFKLGDRVVIEIPRNGLNVATVVIVKEKLCDSKYERFIKNEGYNKERYNLIKFVRFVSQEDLNKLESNKEKSENAKNIAIKQIEDLRLKMSLLEVEYTFDLKKMVFYFISNGRVDFRKLVTNMARIFRSKIEMRQISVRDEAKRLGGIGICGKPFCCSTFLSEFNPVSVKMAKEQSIMLNPSKISGTCGRFMCCLQYERNSYEEMIKNMPKINSIVKTTEGVGSVVEVVMIKNKVKVKLTKEGSKILKFFDVRDIEEIKE
ncbi:MAG: stage 0 sporulation protein [Clostridiales bacterium]|nr:stage 0 sporulation protein [Clostridiales bacterium]